MAASFLLWLVALISACTPAPHATYTQHEGRTVEEHRPAEVGPMVTIPGPGDECTEDMDCWDCSTMGDHRCGPINEGELT